MEAEGDGVKVTHEATRWDELMPPFLLRLKLSEDHSSATLLHGGEADDGYGHVLQWLNEAAEEGLMRQEAIKRLVDERIAKDEDCAATMATRSFRRAVDDYKASKKQDGNGMRYWSSKHLPAGVLDGR